MKRKFQKRAIKEEEKREAKRTLADLQRELHKYSALPRDYLAMSEMLAAKAHGGIDIGYIRTILFPELYNADIPQPMSTQSYCRFTDKREISFASKGSGLLLWFPKTVVGPQLFIRREGTLASPIDLVPNGSSSAAYLKGGYTNYAKHFSQASLVSAAISVQYIGQIQQEQGFMVGSQIYGVNANKITPDDAENGQFRVMSKPGDGLRMVYLPKDASDFQYYSCLIGTNDAGKITKAMNQGARQCNSFEKWTYTDVGSNYIEGAVPTNAAITTGVTKADIEYATDTDCVVIYWKGLFSTIDTADLRIDIVRKFNGFPLSDQRDVLDLVKPKKLFDPKKTIDVICELQSAVPQLAGHSLKQMDRISDQIQEFLPNVGHLYNEGLLKEGSTLEGFGQQLQMIAGTEGGGGALPGRLYE